MRTSFNFLAAILVAILFAACQKINHEEFAGENEYYTCSMDPQVVENKAGKCPICHMSLIIVKNNDMKAGQIKLSDQQIKLANITFDTLHLEEMAKEVSLTGKITLDQNFSEAISAKVQGRIEKLAVKNVGDFIHKGQLLYEIYSEELNTAQLEYVFELEKTNSFKLNSATTRNKLLLYGMTEEQVKSLESMKQIAQYVSVYSLNDGYVSEIPAVEGNYVASGTTLFKLASLNSLWVEAQVYLPYLPYLKIGTDANFFIPAVGNNLFHGKVIFIDPQVQSPNRFVLARFELSNPNQEIKPGMMANISLQTEKKQTLSLPIGSVIQDSKGANVWLRREDGIFENRKVVLGMQNSRQIEITSGLSEGNIVIISGAYLLNSEYIFKKGANPSEKAG